MKQHVVQTIGFICIALSVCFYSVAFWGVWSWGRVFQTETNLISWSFIQRVADRNTTIRQTDGVVNILLLGIGGANHEGGDLTDTIIITSWNLKTKQIALISIPRDIWSETLQDKVNSAYHYGEIQKKGEGLSLAKKIVSEISGQPMHYAVLFDFSQFQTIVDALGGIDINVRSAFTDEQYPILGKEQDMCGSDYTFACRYEMVSFDLGWQHMDGKRALQYVRSRYATNGDGNDFSRGRRQQDVIIALKDAIIKKQPVFHPDLALKLYRLFDQATEMDATVDNSIDLLKNFQTMPAIRRIAIDSVLMEPQLGIFDRYVLLPVRSGAITDYLSQELRGNVSL